MTRVTRRILLGLRGSAAGAHLHEYRPIAELWPGVFPASVGLSPLAMNRFQGLDARGDSRESRREPEVSIARLPITSSSLFGRESDLEWLSACWREGVHVASIVAWGGVGKSALVNAWLARLRDSGWDGAVKVYGWSFYTQGTDDRLTSSDEFFSAALRWFKDPDPAQGSPWDKGERLATLVRQEKTILILDGVEPLQWGPSIEPGRLKDPALQSLVKELGAHNKGLCIITSRLPVVDLEPLAGRKVRRRNLGDLSPDAGAELLKARGARGLEEELRDAATEYRGHSLALTLLGSYLEAVAGGDIRQRKEIGPLEKEERQGAHARRVMAAYQRWLGSDELGLLRIIGLFDRPAEEDDIEALRADPPVRDLTEDLTGVGTRAWKMMVAKLHCLGLLSTEHDKALDAHPLVREYFGQQLKNDRPEAWREGHRRLFEHLKRKAKPFPETIEEMAPLYAAIVHGCMAEKDQEALDDVYWARVQRWPAGSGRGPRENEHFNQDKLGAFGSEAAILSAFFTPPWERLSDRLHPSSHAGVIGAAGVALWALGRSEDATHVMWMGLERFVAQRDWTGAAVAASKVSEVLQARGKLDEALTAAQKSVELAKRSGDLYEIMANWTTLGAVLHALGRTDEATTSFENAEGAQKEREPAFPLLFSLWSFRYCDLLLDQGKESSVLRRAEALLARRSPSDSLLWNGLDHLTFGRAHLLAVKRETGGELGHATVHLNQAVERLRAAGYQDYLAVGLIARAHRHVFVSDVAAARRDLDEAMSIAIRCGFLLHEAKSHLGMAQCFLAEERPEHVREHVDAARKIIHSARYHRAESELRQVEASLTAWGSRATRTLTTPANIARPDAPSTAVMPPVVDSPPDVSFPPPILAAYRERKLAVLFGSGLSLAKDVRGSFPRWGNLTARFFEEAVKEGAWTPTQASSKRAFLQEDGLSLEGLLAELETAKVALQGVRKYQSALNRIFRPRDAAAGDVHRALLELDVDVLATTNYDELLEHSSKDSTRAMFTWKESDKALSDIQDGRKVLFKIHGTAQREDTVVMTREEYGRAAAHAPYHQTMRRLLQSYTFLLVGYGINDPFDLDLVFEFNLLAFGSATTMHYALVKDASATDRDRWRRDLGVQVVPYRAHDELPAILRALAAFKP